MSVRTESKGKWRHPDLTGSPDRPSTDCFPCFAALPLCGHSGKRVDTQQKGEAVTKQLLGQMLKANGV